MKTNTSLIKIFLLLVLTTGSVIANDLHPEFPLLDKQGYIVVDSGSPLSTIQTCGACHDTDYIISHSDHSDAGAKQLGSTVKQHPWDVGPGYFGAWNAIDYDVVKIGNKENNIAWLARYGSRHVGGGPVNDKIEMDCLLCHSNITDNTYRDDALKSGNVEWANSAPLATLGILKNTNGRWLWNLDKFNNDGNLTKGLLLIRKPRDENCAQCHGMVSNTLSEPLVLQNDSIKEGMTIRTGQIISPQKINISGLNITDKDAISRPFDVHSDRVLGCVNCHYSLNNPVYFQRRNEDQPEHLVFDPRRLTSADYLYRPLHQFAKGNSNHGLASESNNSLRRCESCHEAENVHQWLPHKGRHFAALACESCHIPELYGPTLQSIDWSMLNLEGQPLKEYRNSGIDYSKSTNIVSSFKPVLLPRTNVGGTKKLAPFNLVTSWYWTSGEPAQPVSRNMLKKALFEPLAEKFTYNASLLNAFDSDGDKSLTGEELKLDTDEKVTVVKSVLEASGLTNLSLNSEVSAYAISHNVVNGKWAIKKCNHCHQEESHVDGEITLASYNPGGGEPTLRPHQGMEFSGSIVNSEDGRLSFQADASQSGFYIIGRDGIALVDIIGLLMFFGISLGVSGHAIARKIANRRMGPVQHKHHREYIYDAYERLWHWMQAISIIVLIFTGLIIHKPHIFGIFSFSYIVQVHNVVGFILLINAVFSLFYNLASGEIKQYLPEPKGFIGRSIAQAMYYSKGIFEGAHHPIAKSHDHKMNPLQQVTYLAILSMLLPAQIITGTLIWGAQEWPEIAQLFGGLPLLAPIHTLLAWAFAAFIVMHVYLTTTGHTATAGIKAMIEGWDEVEDAPDETN